jgi:hypothetical protein
MLDKMDLTALEVAWLLSTGQINFDDLHDLDLALLLEIESTIMDTNAIIRNEGIRENIIVNNTLH